LAPKGRSQRLLEREEEREREREREREQSAQKGVLEKAQMMQPLMYDG